MEADGSTCTACNPYEITDTSDNSKCVRGICALERTKLEADGSTCTPCNSNEITDPNDNSKCVLSTPTNPVETPCGLYEITDPNDNTRCVRGSCTEERAKLETDGSTCTPCNPYEITDPSDNSRCIEPNCPQGQSPTADGLCQNTSAFLDELNIRPAPLFIDYPDPIKILVNPLEQDKEYSLNVGDYVDLNTNLPE